MPPVTAERSPPDSRITGADSPVIADSSTDATPSTTSPSPGMRSPGVHDDEVARARARWPDTDSNVALVAPDRSSRLAWVSRRDRAQRVGLRLAPAFGHRLGEIGEEHGEPEPERDLEA